MSDLPDGWEIVKLREVSIFNPESVKNRFSSETVIEYVELSNIDAGTYTSTQMEYGNAPSRAQRAVKHNDILVGTVRPYLRRFAIIKKPSPNLIVSTGFTVVRVLDAIPEYIHQYIWSESFVSHLIKSMVGSNFPAVSEGDIGIASIPLPPLAEQRKIAEILSTWDEAIQLVGGSSQSQENPNSYLHYLREQKKGLMQRLLTGAVRVDV